MAAGTSGTVDVAPGVQQLRYSKSTRRGEQKEENTAPVAGRRFCVPSSPALWGSRYISGRFWQLLQLLSTVLLPNVNALRVRSRYSVRTMLGRGTYGQAMRAQCRSSGQAYAMKIILPDQDLRVTGRKSEAFPREVQIMRKIKHVSTSRGTSIVNIAMELAEHGTLSKYLQGHHIDEGKCAGLSWQVVDALRYLHRSTVRIIHRDVKPENVLLTSMNPTIFKLTDFRSSKMITAKRFQTREVGATEYMAPEVLLCHDLNELVDEWPLGVMIYYMLLREFPFNRNSLVGGAHKPVTLYLDMTGIWNRDAVFTFVFTHLVATSVLFLAIVRDLTHCDSRD
ncbi:kinase-like protein [Panus rudis PR-1116 ss-1]|nr:kinase-like protein [Panus rudis PR-1116 ss-1]